MTVKQSKSSTRKCSVSDDRTRHVLTQCDVCVEDVAALMTTMQQQQCLQWYQLSTRTQTHAHELTADETHCAACEEVPVHRWQERPLISYRIEIVDTGSLPLSPHHYDIHEYQTRSITLQYFCFQFRLRLLYHCIKRLGYAKTCLNFS